MVGSQVVNTCTCTPSMIGPNNINNNKKSLKKWYVFHRCECIMHFKGVKNLKNQKKSIKITTLKTWKGYVNRDGERKIKPVNKTYMVQLCM